MSSCCCSLAGTSACRTCPNNPNADFNGVNKFYVTTDTTEVRIEPYIETSAPKVNKDLVEVVRCKDCQNFHRRQSMFGKEYTECDLYCAMQPAEEDYCSRGRLKNVQNVQ